MILRLVPAFSSEADTGWREENASNKEIEPSDSIGTEKALYHAVVGYEPKSRMRVPVFPEQTASFVLRSCSNKI
jgi:hypothetical protein